MLTTGWVIVDKNAKDNFAAEDTPGYEAHVEQQTCPMQMTRVDDGVHTNVTRWHSCSLNVLWRFVSLLIF